jgi:drug/metabolite transporter (DMT)-like permease
MRFSSYRVGVLFIVLSSLAYGMLPATLRFIYQNSALKPTDIAIWRYVLAVPMIWIAMAGQRTYKSTQIEKSSPPYRVPLWHLFILGFLYGVCVLLAFFGLERLPVGVFLLLYYTYPAMVALSSYVLGQSLPRVGWIALGLTMLGAVLTISDTGSNKAIDPVGIGLALLHAVAVTVFFLAAGHLMRNSRDTTRNTAWQLTATLLFLLVCVPFFGFQWPPSLAVWLGLLILAGVCTGLPIFALNAGIQRIGPTQAAIIGTLEPVVGIFTAFVVLHEPIGIAQLIGTFLILFAVILLQYKRKTLDVIQQPVLSNSEKQVRI